MVPPMRIRIGAALVIAMAVLGVDRRAVRAEGA
jgi:hypothetical protein